MITRVEDVQGAGSFAPLECLAGLIAKKYRRQLSFSEVTGMPIALLNRSHILALRQTLTKLEHVKKQYYRFQLRSTIADAGYDSWKQRFNAAIVFMLENMKELDSVRLEI